MGNVQTSTNVYNVNGDNNAFTPNSEMVASASPAIDLKPGVLNPNGKLYQLESGSAPDPSNLVIVVDATEGDFSYITNNTWETLNKSALETNSWEPLFAVTMTGCGPLKLNDYTVTMSGYVGASADDAFDGGVVEDGMFISSRRLKNFKLMLSNRCEAIAKWNTSLNQAMSLLTPDLLAGSGSCKWKSILQYMQATLPADNEVLQYPDEFYTVAVSKYPALKPGASPNTPLPVAGPLGEIASVMNAASSSVGLMNGSSALLTSAMDTLAAKNLDLVCAEAPLPVATFAPSLVPRDYRPAFIKDADAHWITSVDPSAIIRVTTALSGRDYTVQLGPGATKLIDMNRMVDADLLLDVSGMPINWLDNPDYATAVAAIVLLEAKVPATEINVAADITGVSVVASSPLSIVNSTINVRGQSYLEMLHLRTTFERETIAGKPYIYGFGCLMLLSPTTSSNTRNPTLMDGLLTVTPILLRETTYKGEIVEEIVPSDILGNHTSEEMAVALANDAVFLMENSLKEVAEVIGSAVPIASDIDDSATASVVSRLAIAETISMRARSGNYRAFPDFGALWKKAKRAASLFVSNPKSVLQVGVPVLASAGVLDALTSAVGTSVRTGNIGKGVQDAVSILRARNSVTKLRQGFFSKIEELWPVLDG
ncbi:putative outer capsid protein [Etheostoma fonticola aquareovirus]|uniref:putative outer capsid protein n=1 Tax=Etheostoma fonticola aquareovirus TaxID=1862978 RepID=UPI0007F0BA6E|nr:putative outer capsid protein [Etheostoma fonticola aquareovirus]ANN11951.1 putative outer capsid protein [Etheostoma fonticola aquareovirus]